MLKLLRINLGFVLLLVSGCSSSNNIEYPYKKGLYDYFNSAYKINLNEVKNTVFYLVPLNACSPCVESNLDLLLDKRFDSIKIMLMPVFVSEVNVSGWVNKVSSINKKYNKVLYDSKGMLDLYETGILGPFLVHIVDGNVVYFLNVTDSNIAISEEYLLGLLPN